LPRRQVLNKASAAENMSLHMEKGVLLGNRQEKGDFLLRTEEGILLIR